jgi:hypothetical protein
MRIAWMAPGVALIGLVLGIAPSATAASSSTAPPWTAIQAPGPNPDSTGYHLNAVDCWAVGDCVAVGHYASGGTTASFIDEDTNGTWSYVATTGQADLTDVSCPAAGACVAVGTAGIGSSFPQGVLEVQSSTTWTTIMATGAQGRYASYTGALKGISCAAANSCAAVGQAQSNAEVNTGFTLTLRPGNDPTAPASWMAQQAPEKAGDAPYENAGLADVSCVSAGNCRAVGFAYDNPNSAIPLIDNEKNYVWAYGGSPAPTGTTYGQFATVSCMTGGSVCMAGGTYNSNQLPFIATIDTDNDTAEASAVSLPAPFLFGELSASSCAPDGLCQSVGQAYANSGPEYGYDGFIVSESYGAGGGPSGTATPTDSPSDANSIEHIETLLATSCVSGGFCVSVGDYADNSGPQGQDEASVIDTRTYDSAGAIASETDIKAPEPANDTVNDDQNLLPGVDCQDAAHCTAVGSYFNDDQTQSRGVIETTGTKAPKPPTVTGVAPAGGPTTGGNTVTITGARLDGATAVKFGKTAATQLHVISSTELTVQAPAHDADTVDVRVTSAGGTSAAVTADHYTYAEPPVVKGISPASGSHAGGESVIITGKHLSGTTAVHFGKAAATHVTVVSSTQVDVTAPAHAKGTVDVTVTTPGGTSAKQNADQFRYT